MTRKAPLLALPAIAFLAAALALSTSPAAASPGWELILDRPTPNFGGIDFPTADEGWLVAGAGLLHSTDGGATWTEAAKLTGTDVDFFDTEHGWLVGPRGAIYGTTDGGETWEAQTTGTDVYLSQVVAVGPEEAWVAGVGAGPTEPIVRPESSAFLHTTDGGRTWEHVDTPPRTRLREVAFAGDRGWALGDRCREREPLSPPDVPPPDPDYCYHPTEGTLLRTLDGGDTWEELDVELSTSSRSLTFVSQTHGWFTNYVCITGTDSCRREIARTQDGGMTWEAIDVSTFGSPVSVAFRNDSAGWALVQECEAYLICSDSVISTTDGGASWRQGPVVASNDRGYGHRIFEANGSLYVTGSYWSGLALRSTDDGMTWEGFRHPALVLNSIDFVDSRVGYGLASGELLISRDGGRQWTVIPNAPSNPSLIDFVSVDVGVALRRLCCDDARVYISVTLDGGRTWRETLATDFSTPTRGEGSDPVAFKMLTAMHGFFAVEGGFGFTQDGGGASWRTIRIRDVGPYARVNAAALADPEHVWAIVTPNESTSSNVTLIHSDDGGTSWSETPVLGRAYGIQFVDSSHGWYISQDCTKACTNSHSLFGTRDGGRTWTNLGQRLQPTYGPSLTFVDRLNAWLNETTCEETVCTLHAWHSADGGRTWNRQLSEGRLERGTFDFIDARHGWLLLDPLLGFGVGGAPFARMLLYHTTDGGGGPIGLEPTPAFPDAGGGAGSANTGRAAWIVLAAAMGAAALAASVLVARRARR
jgi:photosystem II stability/assembly factor-like uncharacterized protein